MGCVLLVARKEVLEHLRSLRFLACAAVMTLISALSVFVMYRDYRVRMENYAVLEARATPRPGESGVMAVVAPRPLSIFARGLDDVMDRGYEITSYNGITPHDRQTPAVSLFSLVPAPDLLYVVKVLLSLVALLFAYDTISGEKEKGTLRLLLSFPVSRGEVVAGKMIGGLAVVAVPFLVPTAALAVAVRATGGVALSGGEGLRLALMMVASLFYVAAFFALGVLVSARARSSPQALVVLLFVWAVVVFALPGVGQLVAAGIAPLPSGETQEALRVQAFARSRFLDIQSRGRDPAGSFTTFNRDYDALVEQYRARLGELVATSKRLCRVSPAASLTYAFTDLAGTGIGDLQRLDGELMRYKSRNLATLVSQRTPGAPPPPRFVPTPETLAGAWRGGLVTDFLLLGSMAAALTVAAAFASATADVR